jgi:hypothetical protein
MERFPEAPARATVRIGMDMILGYDWGKGVGVLQRFMGGWSFEGMQEETEVRDQLIRDNEET